MLKVKAAKTYQLNNGEMKEIEAGGRKALLIKNFDTFYALSPKCNHYGAPLNSGVLSGERVVCPWHHAAFNIKNGKMIEPPAIDNIHSFEVIVEGEDIFINFPEEDSDFRPPDMHIPDEPRADKMIVILGGGAAGNIAAQTLRTEGFDGRIHLITQEDKLPYDRPNLSKEYLQGKAPESWMPLRSRQFFERNKINLIQGKKVVKINTEGNQIFFDDESWITYHKLLISPGAVPVKLGLKGEDLDNVFYLRSYSDSDRIINSLNNVKNAVVIGAGFIAMETATSLGELGIKVDVAAPEKLPFAKKLGHDIGEMLKKEHERKGVRFHMESKPVSFIGDSKVEEVELDNGKRLKADLVIIGVGVRPATDMIKDIHLNEDGSLKTDEYMRVKNDVYAAGDAAYFVSPINGKHARIEHWRTAHQQGISAAKNMLGQNEKFAGIPFFWTEQAGLQIQYVGHTQNWEDSVTVGSIEDKNFIRYYIEEGKVAAAAGIRREKELGAVEELMRMDMMPPPDRLKDFKPVEELNTINLNYTSSDLSS